MNTRFSLTDELAAALEATRIPGAAAALHAGGATRLAAGGVRQLGQAEPVEVDTPFRIASITKSFTATLVAESGALDERRRALLAHVAGYRPESRDPLPEVCTGLWSYSNAGYWEAAESLAVPFEAALAEGVLDPLGLGSTGFDEPPGCARGHVQEGATGHRAVGADAYPVERRASGGLWSTVGDLVRYGLAHCRGYAELHEPQADALGGRYALGWWVRDGVLDHEGSVAGYQSLVLLVPAEELVLAVLTNSWRGSGLVRRLVDALEVLPAPSADGAAPPPSGTYALDSVHATVTDDEIVERERDPVTGAAVERRYLVSPVGGGVYGFARGTLMGHRVDFPRADVARIGWTALPRVA
ncbi:MAG TPA: serine hydrolase domain-containing protein [Gaiellaceae bacterium]|nr:serine hydrolase domain-containing protein [Gaiellaceae bacterium]